MSVNKIRKLVTSHDYREKGTYMQVNYAIVYCYNSLGGKRSQVANCIFQGIIRNRQNKRETQTKPDEDIRIYNDKPLDPENILKDLNSIKYNTDLQAWEKDRSNLQKLFVELHNNNVFYCFLSHGCYIFFMERDIGCWKYFNDNACVVPNSLSKIINLAQNAMRQTIIFSQAKGKKVDSLKIESDFGLFINDMIGKMNSLVADKITKWKNGQDLNVYLKGLLSILKGMDDFYGLSQAPDFLDKLPLTVRNRMEKLMMQEGKNKVEMEKLLSPKKGEENLTKGGKKQRQRQRQRRGKKITDSTITPTEALIHRWKDEKTVNPFENGKCFVIYYRNYLKYYANQNLGTVRPRFENFGIDGPTATEILDLLIDNDRSDKLFLDKWFEYFCVNNLRGRRIAKLENTSLRNLMKTFDNFNKSFVVPR